MLSLLFLAWGSFLNVVACHLLADTSLFSRSRSWCPACRTSLAWYDLIPLLSWLLLRAQCRTCKAPISYLYPLIELATALVFMGLVVYVDARYWLAYGILSSALIVTVRTDLQALAVSRFMSIYVVPLGWVLAFLGFLPISVGQSLLGSVSAYLFLYGLSWLFFKLTGKEGLGLGDVELLALIGSFLGPLGWWVALLSGACLGSIVGMGYLLVFKAGRYLRIPFCPFLALGAWLYMFWPEQLIHLIGLGGLVEF